MKLVQQLSPDLLREIKKLHFQTRRLADQGVVGRYRSAFRGIGMEFEEVREYSPGDDIRSIDWKVTARSRKPYIKSYREERELTVIIAVDVSRSTLTGTKQNLRETLIARLGAVLTLIALNNNDKVGLVTFSDHIEKYFPPRKTRGAVWRILHEVMTPANRRGQTDLAGVFHFLRSMLKKRSIIFLISDLFASDYEQPMAAVAKRHDLTILSISDCADFQLPQCGLISLEDPESGQIITIDSSDPRVFEAYSKSSQAALQKRKRNFLKHGIGLLELSTDRPFINDIKRYFESRSKPKRASVRKAA